MEPQTTSVSTQDWLEASHRIHIRAYIEAYMPTINVPETPFQCPDFYDSLKQVGVSIRMERIRIDEPQFGSEFQSWDILSDEALKNFEQQLG